MVVLVLDFIKNVLFFINFLVIGQFFELLLDFLNFFGVLLELAEEMLQVVNEFRDVIQRPFPDIAGLIEDSVNGDVHNLGDLVEGEIGVVNLQNLD